MIELCIIKAYNLPPDSSDKDLTIPYFRVPLRLRPSNQWWPTLGQVLYLNNVLFTPSLGDPGASKRKSFIAS